MGSRFFGSFLQENSPILLPGIVGFVFLLGAIQIYRNGEPLLHVIVFLACSLCLLIISAYHFTKKGTPAYGKTITSHERWEEMPGWKRLALLIFVILFLLVWMYLFLIWIMRGGVPFDTICLGTC